jgi:hypothetical protein
VRHDQGDADLIAVLIGLTHAPSWPEPITHMLREG